ncbi:two component transcriptional regulator, winged helix family [Nautilia profundicola AmH]|uniref:Two component transcriptional regulator, winged helix family n=1 Tax=Nautilia profundicola (strain ATCC BAA-1463 / DSM 18972 / AmH) TaxID=598659 RepID=B9L7F7_NAUPA|nr:response regulator transcription factor [Nautilia profundicola]ACM92839.1 two component transcriptional regulator, winged helix family [Nautilia profundicola AmH]
MKILLVEDDKQLGRVLKKTLEAKGYEVHHIEDGEDAFNDILINEYDVYLLDINLPKIDGIKLIKLIRHKNPKAIIIMITASAQIEDMEKAYGENHDGCDEYIKKPFHSEELLLRINHWLKVKNDTCNNNEEKEKITIDNMEFYFDTLDLYIDGVLADLRKKEKRLLAILLKNIGKTVKKDEIVKYVWENANRKEYPLRQLVSELKNKLPGDYITSVVGIGYRFDKK